VFAPAAAAELRAWLRLTQVPGIGAESQRRLLQAFVSPEAVFAASAADLERVVGAAAERLLHHDAAPEIEQAMAWAERPGNRIITLGDAEYPQALLDTEDPPSLLYVVGDPALLNRPALAVVGSRNATRQGELDAEAFCEALAQAGLVIVSGLALGIDAAAHRGALKAGAAGGGTVAVIGTGADRIYPARNEGLARAIAESGTLISEFPLGTPALAGNFPRRNRIIAGLSRGCLVIEAAERSGSLITARLSAEAGRDVFAIPGSIHAALAKGCHRLIKQGAKLVESAQDILEELNWQGGAPSRPAPAAPPPAAASAALLDALGHHPIGIDVLLQRSRLTTDTLLAMLLQLELDGRVAVLPGGRYQRLD
jgi:DNA processing protein